MFFTVYFLLTSSQYIGDVLNTSSSAYAHYENARYLIPTSFLYNLSYIYKNFSIDEVLGRKKQKKYLQ